MSVLLADKQDGIAILTLNRPEKLNALSIELREALYAELTALVTDASVRVVILTGAGRAFCAGLDLIEMGESGEGAPRSNVPEPASLLRALPQPVIGAINGLAVTGGFEISLSCDILIATPEARFADTHARLGLIAGWGLGARLSRAIGLARAKELSLTGNYLPADRAYEWGLVNRVVPAAELMTTCLALAGDMLSCVPETMVGYKRQIDRCFDLALADAMTMEKEINRMHRGPGADVVAERRSGVLERGREQAS